jgi:hypothetical protein
MGFGALIISLAAALLLRLASFFEPYSYADEGIYLVLGRAFRQGLVFYRDIHDNKPPLLYLTAALAGNLINFRLILAAVNGVNIWLVWRFSRELFKKNFKAVLAATLGFAILSCFPWFEGNIANAELFMILPLTAAALLVWRRQYWLAGLLAAAAFLFKVPAAFDLFGLMLFLVWRGRGWPAAWVKVIAGFLAVNLAVLAYYVWQGAGERYLTSALLQNVPYLTSWGGASGGSILANGLVWRLVLAGIWTGLIFYFRNKLKPATAFLGLWFIFSLYGVLLSGRPYSHYWIEILPVAALMVGWALVGKGEAVKLLFAGLALAAVSWRYFAFWSYPVAAYYANFLSWASGRQDELSYRRYWGDEVIDDQKTAEFIRQRTKNSDRIYVWGTAPGIYYLADRLPVGRYTVAYHVADFNGFEETIEALAVAKPPLIVKLADEDLEFSALDALLTTDYQLIETIGTRQIYLRLIE